MVQTHYISLTHKLSVGDATSYDLMRRHMTWCHCSRRCDVIWLHVIAYPNDTFHRNASPPRSLKSKTKIYRHHKNKLTKTFPFFWFEFVLRDTKESQFSDLVDSRNLTFSLENCHNDIFLSDWCYTPEIHQIKKLTHCVGLVCCLYTYLLCHSNTVIIPFLYISLMGILIAGEYTHLRLFIVCMSVWRTAIIPHLSVIGCQEMITLIFKLTRPHFFHQKKMQTRT